MRISLQVLFLLAACLVLGCGDGEKDKSNESSNKKKDETAQKSDQQETETEAKEFVIDVRSQAEWDAGHLEQAVLIPHTEISDRIGEVTEDKSAKIVLYWKVGGRAGRAKEALEKLGYTNVENGGGFEDMKKRYNQ